MSRTSERPFNHLGVPISARPMEARLVESLPDGDGWQYEPKWDGFRCLAFRDGDDIAMMSKSGKSLDRYFPELIAVLQEFEERRFVLDGEIVLPIDGVLSFADLQARLHPAASRIAKLSRTTPAQLILFDCLQIGSDEFVDRPLEIRRKALETFAKTMPGSLTISPATTRFEVASTWLEQTGGALDGVMAKRLDEPYRPGERAMFKHKVQRTADCVVGGYRYDKTGQKVASLLLGLYDDAGLLHHVGYSSSFSQEDRAKLAALVEPLKGPSGFTGSAPGGASRWSKPGTSRDWVALKPTLIAEVTYDQVTGNRFRHGTTFRRWRPDKAPAQCTFDQLAAELGPEQIERILSV